MRTFVLPDKVKPAQARKTIEPGVYHATVTRAIDSTENPDDPVIYFDLRKDNRAPALCAHFQVYRIASERNADPDKSFDTRNFFALAKACGIDIEREFTLESFIGKTCQIGIERKIASRDGREREFEAIAYGAYWRIGDPVSWKPAAPEPWDGK